MVQFIGDSALKEARAGARGLNMAAGTEAESVENVLLVGLLAVACFAICLIQPKSTPAGMVPSTVPGTLLSKKNAPQTCPQTNLVEPVTQLRFFPDVSRFVSS